VSHIPRQRPYWDACADCPDSPRVPPVLVSDAAPDVVLADYVCAAGHTWVTRWARDPDYEGRAS
jgi:hypothetical protein